MKLPYYRRRREEDLIDSSRRGFYYRGVDQLERPHVVPANEQGSARDDAEHLLALPEDECASHWEKNRGPPL